MTRDVHQLISRYLKGFHKSERNTRCTPLSGVIATELYMTLSETLCNSQQNKQSDIEIKHFSHLALLHMVSEPARVLVVTSSMQGQSRGWESSCFSALGSSWGSGIQIRIRMVPLQPSC